MSTSKEGFASRWSRLKSDPQTVQSDAETEDTAPTIEDISKDSAIIDEDTLTDVELLEKYALPDPETMKAGDNFSAFMREAVPDRLRRRALRVLWGSNPILANLDELVDYGEDYTDAATVIENMQTIYKVGKGSAWKFQEEQARIAAEKAAAEAEAAERRAHNGEPAEETTDPALDKEDETLPEPEEIEPEPEVAALSEEDTETAPPLPQRPRAMRFEFD